MWSINHLCIHNSRMPGILGTKIDILRRNKMTEWSIRPTGTTCSGREKMKPQTLFCLLSSDGSLITTASRQADVSVLIPLPSHFSNHLSQSTANHMSRGPGTTHTLKAAGGPFSIFLSPQHLCHVTCSILYLLVYLSASPQWGQPFLFCWLLSLQRSGSGTGQGLLTICGMFQSTSTYPQEAQFYIPTSS